MSDNTKPEVIFLGEAIDVKEYPLEPITYLACENHKCAYNQVIAIDFDYAQHRYYHVCGFTNEDAKKCMNERKGGLNA